MRNTIFVVHALILLAHVSGPLLHFWALIKLRDHDLGVLAILWMGSSVRMGVPMINLSKVEKFGLLDTSPRELEIFYC